MANKKGKGGSGKIVAKREAPAREEPKKAAPAAAPAKPRVTERIEEKDAGFGVIKVIAGVVIALIVGSAILNHFYGGDAVDRGDKGQDERCTGTQECKAGFVCQAYGSESEKCLKTCEVKNAQSCDPGYKCISTTRQSGRKKFRFVPVCIPDAQSE